MPIWNMPYSWHILKASICSKRAQLIDCGIVQLLTNIENQRIISIVEYFDMYQAHCDSLNALQLHVSFTSRRATGVS
jgi:hypothetical protein